MFDAPLETGKDMKVYSFRSIIPARRLGGMIPFARWHRGANIGCRGMIYNDRGTLIQFR
jgi:hypothetical protein